MDQIANVTSRFSVALILLATCASTYAQTGPTGTWRIDGDGPSFPWEVSLIADGPSLRGAVNNCVSPQNPEISEGHIDGASITFKCTRGDGVTKIAFTGKVNGDEITLTWETLVPDGVSIGTPAANSLFSPLGPHRFTVRRVPDNPAGTWRVNGAGGATLWEAKLIADGTRLTGAVSSCASNRGVIVILEGKADQGVVKFKCKGPNRAATLILTGRIRGNELTFTWEKQPRRDGSSAETSADDLLFGPTAPSQFTAKRVPEGYLAITVENNFVRGSEFAAAVNLIRQNVKASASIFIPEGCVHVRAVLTAVDYGTGSRVLNSPQWPELARSADTALLVVKFSSIAGSEMGNTGVRTTDDDGRADALVALLRQMAQESEHSELNNSPLLFWGQSFSTFVASIFAERFSGSNPRIRALSRRIVSGRGLEHREQNTGAFSGTG